MLTYNSLENIRGMILKQQVYYKNYIKIQPERVIIICYTITLSNLIFDAHP